MDTDDVGVTGRPEPIAPEDASADLAPSKAATAVHRRARTAGQDAKALKAQAGHQRRQARRNLAAACESRRARVLVVDDSPVFLGVADSLISATPSLRLVGVAASGMEAIELLPQLKPDFVLVDINMPGLDGVETAAVIGTERPEAVVVLISAEATGLDAAGREAGAAAVVEKRRLVPDTLETLWSTHRPGRE